LSKCTYLNLPFWNERTDLNLPFGNERISRNSFGNERISRYSFRNDTESQHEQIRSELDKYDGDLRDIQQQIEDGKDPRLLSTWKSPVEMEIKQPTRGECILPGRRVRAKLFGTQHGAKIIADGYYSNCLLPKGGVHAQDAEYLYYDKRVEARAKQKTNAKEIKVAKKNKKIAKEKEQVLTFATAMADCGMWFADEHEFDPDEVAEDDLDCYE
jgi:hypothetical protein